MGVYKLLLFSARNIATFYGKLGVGEGRPFRIHLEGVSFYGRKWENYRTKGVRTFNVHGL